ncbi:hypothetical protein Tco_1425656, partial [Tanacetum coccineum]
HAPRGVPIGPKLGFKPVKQVYRPVSKKNNVNTSGNKKKDAESRKDVSNPNLFDVLNSVENDVDLGTNRGTSNLASKKRPILVDPHSGMWDLVVLGKPLENIDYLGDHDSEDEVEQVDYDIYNDDMYEGYEIPDNIQSICDNLDIS